MLKSIVKTKAIINLEILRLENRSLDTDNKLVPVAVIYYLKCRKCGNLAETLHVLAIANMIIQHLLINIS